MSDVDWIFVALIGLYLIESMAWLKPGSSVFVRFCGTFRSPLSVLQLFGNDAGTLVLGGPLTSDASFICEPLPISIAPEGVVSFVPASPLKTERCPATGLLFTWSELEELRLEEQKLLVNERTVCRPRNSRSAKYLYETLRHISKLGAEKRSGLASHLIASTLNHQDTREQLDQWRRVTRRLRFASALRFLWTLPLGIVLFYELVPLPFKRNWQFTLTYLTILVVLWWWTTLEGFLAHRKLLPFELGGRLKLLFTSLISPVVPMRAADRLGRDLFLFVHPLAFAAAIDDRKLMETCSREIVRDLEFPLPPELPPHSPPASEHVVQWSTSETISEVKQMLSELKIDYDGFLAAPERSDKQSQSYCPRCHDDYHALKANCSRCGNRPTVPFSSW